MHYILLFQLFIEGLVYSGNKPVIVFFYCYGFTFLRTGFGTWNLLLSIICLKLSALPLELKCLTRRRPTDVNTVTKLTFPKWTWPPVWAPTWAGPEEAERPWWRGWGRRGRAAAGSPWQTAAALTVLWASPPAGRGSRCRTGILLPGASLRKGGEKHSRRHQLGIWILGHLSTEGSLPQGCFVFAFIWIYQRPAEKWNGHMQIQLGVIGGWKRGRKLVWTLCELRCFCHLSPLVLLSKVGKLLEHSGIIRAKTWERPDADKLLLYFPFKAGEGNYASPSPGLGRRLLQLLPRTRQIKGDRRRWSIPRRGGQTNTILT